MTKSYLSGQIGNLDFAEVEANFDKATVLVAAAGYDVINPLRVVACDDVECGGGKTLPDGSQFHNYECYMRHDILAMLECESISMLPNYRNSRGAMFELEVARMCGLEVRIIANDYNSIFMPS